jgi:hypothetical protein
MHRAILAALLLMAAGRAFACGCSAQTAELHPHAEKHADVIFVGDVIELWQPEANRIWLVKFKVVEQRRGEREEFITIRVSKGGSSWAPDKARPRTWS